MSLHYEIRITKVETKTALTKGKWAPVSGDGANTVYGYATDRDEETETRTHVLEQCVDVLDFTRVLCAINGIESSHAQ